MSEQAHPDPSSRPLLAQGLEDRFLLAVARGEKRQGVRLLHARDGRWQEGGPCPQVCLHGTRRADTGRYDSRPLVRDESVRESSPSCPGDSGSKRDALRHERRSREHGEDALPTGTRVHAGEYEADRFAPERKILPGLSSCGLRERAHEGIATREVGNRPDVSIGGSV